MTNDDVTHILSNERVSYGKRQRTLRSLITSHQDPFSNFYLAADVRVHDLKLQEDVVAEIFAVTNICAFSFRVFVLINPWR